MAKQNVGSTKYDPEGVKQRVGENSAGDDIPGNSRNSKPAGQTTREQQNKRTIKQGWPELVTPDLVDMDLPEPDPNIDYSKPSKHSTRRKTKPSPKRPPARVKSPAGAVMVAHTSDVAELIKTGFDLLASRLGNIWIVSDNEALSIATPLCRILGKFEQSKVIAENLDVITLVTMTGTVIIPRIILQKEMVNAARATTPSEKGGMYDERQTIRDDRGTANSNQQSSNFFGIKQLIPPISNGA